MAIGADADLLRRLELQPQVWQHFARGGPANTILSRRIGETMLRKDVLIREATVPRAARGF